MGKCFSRKGGLGNQLKEKRRAEEQARLQHERSFESAKEGQISTSLPSESIRISQEHEIPIAADDEKTQSPSKQVYKIISRLISTYLFIFPSQSFYRCGKRGK